MLNNLVRNSRNLFILGGGLAVAAFVLAFVVLSRLSTAQQPVVSAAGGQTIQTSDGKTVIVQAAPTAVPQPMLVAIRDVPSQTAFIDSSIAMKYFKEATPAPNAPPPPADYVGGAPALSSLIATSGVETTRIKIPKGEPLLASELMTTTAPGMLDFASLLHSGEVAESLQIDSLHADNGDIQPGDHVDLLLSLSTSVNRSTAAKYKYVTPFDPKSPLPREESQPVGTEIVTQLTLQNMRVLTVASSPGAAAPASDSSGASAPAPAASGNNIYTLALTHQQALFLKWAKDQTSVAGSSALLMELTVRAGSDSSDIAPVLLKNLKTISSNALVNGSIISNTLQLP